MPVLSDFLISLEQIILGADKGFWYEELKKATSVFMHKYHFPVTHYVVCDIGPSRKKNLREIMVTRKINLWISTLALC